MLVNLGELLQNCSSGRIGDRSWQTPEASVAICGFSGVGHSHTVDLLIMSLKTLWFWKTAGDLVRPKGIMRYL